MRDPNQLSTPLITLRIYAATKGLGWGAPKLTFSKGAGNPRYVTDYGLDETALGIFQRWFIYLAAFLSRNLA